MKVPLSQRIRPNSEAAPWVVNEVKELEKRLKDIEQALVDHPEAAVGNSKVHYALARARFTNA